MTSCYTKSKLMNHTNPWHLSGSILAVHSPLMLLSHFVSANRPWLISFRTCLLSLFALMHMACFQTGLKEFWSTILHKMYFCVHSHSNAESYNLIFLSTVWFSGSKLEYAALLVFGLLFTAQANCGSTLQFWGIFFKNQYKQDQHYTLKHIRRLATRRKNKTEKNAVCLVLGKCN